MFFTNLLLIVIAVLLWTIHQDLVAAAERERDLKNTSHKIANRLEQLTEKDIDS